jgi:hypothetical protein
MPWYFYVLGLIFGTMALAGISFLLWLIFQWFWWKFIYRPKGGQDDQG